MFKNALLNALTYDTITPVIFNGLLTGNTLPTSNYKTMGEKYFGLYEFEGVVTANELADLYSGSPLDEGETEIGGKVYTNLSTGYDDLGELRRGYAVGSKVMFVEDIADTVWYNEGVGKTKLSSASDLSVGDADCFINFGGAAATRNSDYRLEYVIEFDYTEDYAKADTAAKKEAVVKAAVAMYDDLAANGTYVTLTQSADKLVINYNKAIRAEAKITDLDMDNMKEIFAAADYEKDFVYGEVYVGTKSGDDVSDKLSWRKFVAEYINEDYYETGSVNSVAQGNWAKVIDNDGDGKAEYVLRIDFEMVELLDIARGYYYFDGTYSAKVDEDDIVTDDELAEGDIVLITLIDGVYYVDAVEPVTTEIDEDGINYRKETITCGETTYEWSAIAHDAEGYEYDISYAEEEEAYDLYLDHFGYVRLYTESAYNKGFVLLTDAFYGTDRRTSEYKAEIWNVEAADYEDVVVLNPSAARAYNFIENDTDATGREEGTWNRLKEFQQTYTAPSGKTFWTNIAAYSVNEDGEYTLAYVPDASNRVTYFTAEVNTLDADGDPIDVESRKLVNANGRMPAIHTTTDTLYYMLIDDGVSVEILTWVGYENAPAAAVLDEVSQAYAVLTDGDGNYDVAEIVVFESVEADTKTLNFIYALDQKWDPAENKHNKIYTIGYDAETDAYVPEQKLSAKQKDLDIDDVVLFADVYASGTVAKVTDYSAKYIYSGVVTTGGDIDSRDYVWVELDNGNSKSFYTTSVDSYIVEDSGSSNVSKRYSVEAQSEDYEIGQKVIVVCNSKGAILYIINVDLSWDDDAEVYGVAALNALFAEIRAEYEYVPAPIDPTTTYDYAVSFALSTLDKAEAATTIAAKKALVSGDLATAYAKLAPYRNTGDATKDAIVAELYADLAAYSEAFKAEIAAYDAEQAAASDLATAKSEAVVALKEHINAQVQTADTDDVVPAGTNAAEDAITVVDIVPAYQNMKDLFDDSAAAINAATDKAAVTAALNAQKADWDNATFDIYNKYVAAIAFNANAEAKIGDTYYATLATAVAAAQEDDVIVLTKDIELDATITVPAGVTLNGADFEIEYTVASGSAIVLSDETTLKNVTLLGSNLVGGSWGSNYAVQAYDADDVMIENVAVEDFEAAILVNASTVTLKGTVDVSGNEFGGIEVSKGSAVTNPESVLTVEGVVVNTTESDEAPTAWICCTSSDTDPQGSIENVRWDAEYKSAKTQIWYYLP